MDDRFDRRELLLHLGDMLDAMNCLASTGASGASVVHLLQKNDSLRGFECLRALAPTMTVAEFSKRVASAFFLWPRELLETELNRDALASTVQHNLFYDNPDGWNTYISHMQNKVKWFGTGPSNARLGALDEPLLDATNEANPGVPSVEADVRNEKRGWPWPEPRSTS